MITAKHMTFGTDGFGMNYLLTAPTDYDPQKEKLPLIVFLHGVGELQLDHVDQSVRISGEDAGAAGAVHAGLAALGALGVVMAVDHGTAYLGADPGLRRRKNLPHSAPGLRDRRLEGNL